LPFWYDKNNVYEFPEIRDKLKSENPLFKPILLKKHNHKIKLKKYKQLGKIIFIVYFCEIFVKIFIAIPIMHIRRIKALFD